jgi:hypothetical protein
MPMSNEQKEEQLEFLSRLELPEVTEASCWAANEAGLRMLLNMGQKKAQGKEYELPEIAHDLLQELREEITATIEAWAEWAAEKLGIDDD